MIIDHLQNVRHVCARFAGSVHDTAIYNATGIEQIVAQNYPGLHIVGDSAYASHPTTVTPLRDPSTEAEEAFQAALIKIRRSIECFFGIWKGRFPVVRDDDNKVRLDLENAANCIVACCILQNIANLRREPIDPNWLNNDPNNERVIIDEQQYPNSSAAGNARKALLIDFYAEENNLHN